MNVTEDQVKIIMVNLLKMDKGFVDIWLNEPLPVFEGKSPNQMISEGRGSKVISTMTALLPNGRPNVSPR